MQSNYLYYRVTMTSDINIRSTNSSYHIYPIGEQQEEDDNQFITLQHQLEPSFPKHTHKIKYHLSQSLEQHNKSANLSPSKRCKTLEKEQEGEGKRQVLVIKPKQLMLPQLIHPRKNPTLRKNAKEQGDPRGKLQAVISKEKLSFFAGMSSMNNSRQLKPKRIINIGSLNCSHIFLSHLHSKPYPHPSHESISRKQLRKLVMINKMNPSFNHTPNVPSNSFPLKKQ